MSLESSKYFGRLRRMGGWLLGLPAGFMLFAAVVCLNFASMSREIAWGDARPVYEVAESIVHGNGFAIHAPWPSTAPPGRNGKYYAAQPLLPSLVHVPGAGLHRVFGGLKLSPEVSHVLDALACHLAGSFLGALVVWLFFRLCLRYGASQRIALIASALLALASMLWVYARSPFTEIVQIACFLGFFSELSRLLERLDRRRAFAMGLWAGMLVNTKYLYALSLPGAFLVVIAVHFRTLRPLMRVLLHAGAGLLPGVAMALLYNYIRYGSVTATGYQGVGGVMVENPLLGLWGFLFSPGKSVFLYSPPLLLAVLGMRDFWRKHPSVVIAMLATILPLSLFCASLPSWPGDWAWGPRYIVFALPVLLLPAVSFLNTMRWPGRTLAALVLSLGFFVQVLGNAFYWDHYLRIALDVRTKWLGQPNRSGSITADKGGFCEGCFEDVYPTVWLGPFQPILGHFWLLRHVPFGDDWEKAQADAPWRRHTRMPLDERATYPRARVDHWLYDTKDHRVLGWVLLLGLVGVGGAASVVLVRRTRPGEPEG